MVNIWILKKRRQKIVKGLRKENDKSPRKKNINKIRKMEIYRYELGERIKTLRKQKKARIKR